MSRFRRPRCETVPHELTIPDASPGQVRASADPRPAPGNIEEATGTVGDARRGPRPRSGRGRSNPDREGGRRRSGRRREATLLAAVSTTPGSRKIWSCPRSMNSRRNLWLRPGDDQPTGPGRLGVPAAVDRMSQIRSFKSSSGWSPAVRTSSNRSNNEADHHHQNHKPDHPSKDGQQLAEHDQGHNDAQDPQNSRLHGHTANLAKPEPGVGRISELGDKWHVPLVLPTGG